MNIHELPTPCYVIDEKKLKENLEILAGVRDRTECRILLAQKAFSCFYEYPRIADYLDGTTASGLYEARLGYEEMGEPFGLETHVFAPAFKAAEFEEIAGICDHVIFNSAAQLEKFLPICRKNGVGVGLRINPECSTQGDHAIYDPCAPGSRLGVTLENFPEHLAGELSGLHFHTLCEQDSSALATTLKAVEEKFGFILPQLKWLNMGGGHHVTRPGYDLAELETCITTAQKKWHVEVYLEPGEAWALNAGYLATEVLDVLVNGTTHVAMVDTSAACHMPDVIEMPYRPPLYGSGEAGEQSYTYRLGGPTCLAGDVIGDYSFAQPLQPGDFLLFGDMAIYTTCKNNTFNGMPLPAIYVLHETGQLECFHTFGYKDFLYRLGK